jgi:predicted Zn-dependent peptidase
MKTITFEHLHIPAAITTLENGLSVASCQTKSELTEVHRTVALGSMDDGVHRGIAHFVEHMLFEGPTRDSVHPILRPLARKAIYANAGTDYNSTSYELSDGEDVTEQLEAILGMTREIVAPQSVMDMERQVILQEMEEDEVPSRVKRWKMQTVFPHIPGLHYMPDGTKEAVEALALDDLKKHHQRWYGPSNSLILVASQLSHQAVLDLAEKSWLSKAPKSESLQPRQQITAHCVRGEHHSTHESDEVTIYTPLFTVISKRDRILLDMVSDLFTDKSFGLLYVQLRTKLSVVYDVETGLDDFRGLFFCNARTQRKHMRLVDEEYSEALNTIVRGDYSQELFESVINQYYKHFVHEKERAALDGCLPDLEDIWLTGETEDVSSLEVVRAATRDSLSQVASRYLFCSRGYLQVLQDQEE